MPKLKVRKAAKKRYKQVGKNQFVRRKAFKGHILEKKAPKRKRRLGHSVLVKSSDSKVILKMLVC